MSHSKQIIQIEFDNDTSEDEIKTIPGIVDIKTINNRIFIIQAEGEKDIRPELFSYAVKNKLTVLLMQKEESSLEEVFRHLTGG